MALAALPLLDDFPSQSKRLSAPALRLFANVAQLWKLSVAEQRILLGAMPESTYYKYFKRPESAKLSRDTLDRISHIVAIFKAINILLPRKESADSWVRRPNDAVQFKGRSALEYMLTGGLEHIAGVRHYLDAERGW
ncbi:MAG: MbcA/ParS/Xre antitoxin family protein [Vulcanimicrobiaceae bacterium]